MVPILSGFIPKPRSDEAQPTYLLVSQLMQQDQIWLGIQKILSTFDPLISQCHIESSNELERATRQMWVLHCPASSTKSLKY